MFSFSRPPDHHPSRPASRLCALLVGLVLAGLSVLAPPSATAAPSRVTEPPGSSVAERVDAVLAKSPDAVQVADNQVAWPRDGVVLTVTDSAAEAASGKWCGTGRACISADANRGGYTYAFYECRVYRLPEYGFPTGQRAGASSWYNNQTGGAKVIFEDEWFTLPRVIAGYGFGNMPSYLNDRAYWLTLSC